MTSPYFISTLDYKNTPNYQPNPILQGITLFVKSQGSLVPPGGPTQPFLVAHLQSSVTPHTSQNDVYWGPTFHRDLKIQQPLHLIMTKTGQQLPKNRILTHPANTRPGTCTRSQCKNTNSQDNIAPLESRNPTVVDTEREAMKLRYRTRTFQSQSWTYLRTLKRV